MRRGLLLLVLLLAVLSGCAKQEMVREQPASAPETATPAPTPTPTPPPEPEHLPETAPPELAKDEAGLRGYWDKVEEDLRRSPLLERDPALNAYLRDLVCKLEASVCKELRVYLIHAPAFNASMAPNGLMLIYTGLLLRVENEAQLAFVLGHEIGHYRAKHSLALYRSAKRTANILQTLGLAFGGTAQLLAALPAEAMLYKYSRDFEREADQFGFSALLAQGYAPGEPGRSFTQLLKEEKVRDQFRLSAFASHPPTAERAEQLIAMGRTATQTGVTHAERFRKLTVPFRQRWLEDELARRNFGQTEMLLNRLAADGRSGQLAFFRGELYRKRAAPNDLDRALKNYQNAARQADAPVVVFRELGYLLRKLKRPAEANQALQEYVRRAPNAADSNYVRSLIGN
jgi:beta-barrel assembly-enhancing protease